MNFAIVLVNFNGLSDTLECLDSLQQLKDEVFEVIVVDNASDDNQAEKLCLNTAWPTIIANDVNAGWSGGNNLGIRYALDPTSNPGVPVQRGTSSLTAPADVVVLLNNDTVVSPEMLSRLREGFDQGFDIVGPVINEYSDRERVQTGGVWFNRKEHQGFFHHIIVDLERKDEVTHFDIINGCAVAIHRKTFDRIGLIDDRFFLICEESDFCLRAAKAGLRAGLIHRSLVFHKHSVSFHRAGKPLQRYYGSRNLWLLVWRYSGGQRRSLPRSVRKYLRHLYHLYSFEREMNNRAGGDAIWIGLAHAWTGRWGCREIKHGLLSKLLEGTAGIVWRLRGGSAIAPKSVI